MKTYFTFLCLLASTGLASASIQTAVSQDKPPHVYIKSFIMSDQASGTQYYENFSDGSSEEQTMICNGNFYGLMDGTNGLIGAGAADFEMDTTDSDAYYSTFTEHMYEQDTNSTPALVDWQYIKYTTNIYYNGTNTMVGDAFPLYQGHCDTSVNIYKSASINTAYQNLSITGRRSVQAVLKLQTGGKATSKLRNVIGLTVTATQATPNFPYITDSAWIGLWLAEYTWEDHSTGTNISPQNITISSYGNLNNNGIYTKFCRITPMWT